MSNKRIAYQIDDLLTLYETYSKDHRACGIVWQFPMALLTVNAAIIAFLLDKPLILLFAPVVNFGLLHALFKLGHNQGAIIESLQSIEQELASYFEGDRSLIPQFEEQRPRILDLPSRKIIAWLLLLLNSIYFVAALTTAGNSLIKIVCK